MSDTKEIIKLLNPKSEIEWTPYLATAYAEGFCEGEEATWQEQMEAWSYIIMTGMWKNLQGFYGRTVLNIIEMDYIKKDGYINWEIIENDINK